MKPATIDEVLDAIAAYGARCFEVGSGGDGAMPTVLDLRAVVESYASGVAEQEVQRLRPDSQAEAAEVVEFPRRIDRG